MTRHGVTSAVIKACDKNLVGTLLCQKRITQKVKFSRAPTPATLANCSSRDEILAAIYATSARLAANSCNLVDTLNEAARDQGPMLSRLSANFYNPVDTSNEAARDQNACIERGEL